MLRPCNTPPTLALACLVVLLGLSACDKGSGSEPSKDAAEQAKADAPATEATAAPAKTFPKGQRMKTSGCMYAWMEQTRELRREMPTAPAKLIVAAL